jgi:hypothetical protein
VSKRKKKAKKKAKKRAARKARAPAKKSKARAKKATPTPPRPRVDPDDLEGSQVAEAIKKSISERLRAISPARLKELEDRPLPDTITPLGIDEELDELLGGHD